jgi:hypothetical protein
MRLMLSRTISALALSLVLVGASGCAKTIPRVMAGEAFTTGTPAYDDFFASLRSARDDGTTAEPDAIAARAPLIGALGLEPTTADTMVVSETEQRVKKLRDGGVLLHLELLPEARVLSTKARPSLELPAQDVLKGAELSVRYAVALSKRMSALALRAAELEKQRADLRAQAPQTFRGEPQAKRDEVIAELDAAAKVLATVLEGSTRHAGLAAKYTLDLAIALETGAPVLGPLDTPPKGGRGHKGAPPPKPAPPPVAATPPAPAPAKKPADAPAAPPPVAKAPPPPAPPPAAPPKKKPAKSSDDFDP